MAQVYAEQQSRHQGLHSVNTPEGAVLSIVIHTFSDGSVFAGNTSPSLDESLVEESLLSVCEMYGVQPTGETSECNLNTPLDTMFKRGEA